MKLIIPILLLASTTYAGAGFGFFDWRPWYLPESFMAIDSEYGMTASGSGTTNRDMSGQGHTFSATSHFPSQTPNIHNGHSVIRFTNQTQWISTASFFTINSNSAGYFGAICYGSETTNINLLLAYSATNYQYAAINAKALPAQFVAGQTTGQIGAGWTNATTVWLQSSFISSNGVSFFRTNNVSAGNATNSASQSPKGNYNINSIGNVVGSIFLTADIGCEYVYAPQPNASNQVEQYILHNK